MIVKEKREEFLSYLEDASNFREGSAEILYIPENEKEVVEVVKEAVDKKLPLTISGAGTGTVGGRIPTRGGIISLEKLNRVKEVDKNRNRAVLEAGVVIEDFLKVLEKEGFFYPPFPTERKAFIGGNVATNASGEYSFRFGCTRKYVRRIRLVTSKGEVWEIERGKFKADSEGIIRWEKGDIQIPAYISPPIKNSAGYFSQPGMDFIDLFIGSEGTLGVITEVEVEIIPSLPARFIGIAFFKERKVLEAVARIKEEGKLHPYCLEYFDDASLSLLRMDFPSIPQNVMEALYWEDEEKKLEDWAEFLDEFSPLDVWISTSEKDYRSLIEFRHLLPEKVNEKFRKLRSHKIALDIAVPEENFPELFSYYLEVKKKVEGVIFGHIGENHLHFNLFPTREDIQKIYEEAIQKGLELGGTVSAEHGIGKTKPRFLEIMYGKEGIEEMIHVKKEIDPYLIFGPDNLFPYERLLNSA